MTALTEQDWMDDLAGSPIKILETIPYAKAKMFLVSLLSSACAVIMVYFTQHPFWYCCSLIFVVLFNTSMFLTFWGVRDNPKPEISIIAEQQKIYDRKFAELLDQHDFERMVDE
jgi:hypothetical protein